MTGKMILRPGTPDDDNREYLPEKIKGSDIVVNENGNNSQPYPERLKECHGVIADNIEDEWYEYVPESYDPSKKTPLVLSMHGGLMTGWGQAIYTSWTMAADRDGFILVFPNASENRVWQVQWGKWESDPNAPGPDTNTETPDGIRQSPDNVDENHDVHLALGLIERMKEKYNIDAGRIFLCLHEILEMFLQVQQVPVVRHFYHCCLMRMRKLKTGPDILLYGSPVRS